MSTDPPNRHAPALELRGLVAGYGGEPVLRDVDLVVQPGEVVALLGANGAGKSTTLLVCSALVPATSGSVTILGQPVTNRTRPEALARSGLAHVPEDRALFPSLTGREHLHMGVARADARPSRRAAVEDEVLAHFPALARIIDRPAGLLSGGEQQMLALARALAGRPRMLLVDELSLGLAPIIVEQLLPTLRSIADTTGIGILLVEQHVPLALAVADRGAVMRRGRIVAEGPARALAGERDLLEASYLGSVAEGPEDSRG